MSSGLLLSPELPWSPVYANVPYAPGVVIQKVVSWVGGTGSPPSTGVYLGATGYTTDPTQAVNVLGPATLLPIAVWNGPGTAYVPGPPASVVSYNGASYVCAVAHTSTTSFVNDLAAGNWIVLTAVGATGPQGLTGGTGAQGPQGSSASQQLLAAGLTSDASVTSMIAFLRQGVSDYGDFDTSSTGTAIDYGDFG